MDKTIDASRLAGTAASAVELLGELIAFPSVSSTSNVDVNRWCCRVLEQLGFEIFPSEYTDRNGVRKANVVARRDPPQGGDQPHRGLAYFGHTDVVPADQWIGPGEEAARNPETPPDPFTATIHNDRLYGRGACDMKGSIAVMLSAVSRVEPREQTAPIWFVCTADEEIGFGGAKHLVHHCPAYRELVDHDPVALIGEPTELNVVYAHKGVAGFRVHARGRAGHTATNYGINATEAMVPMLVKLLQLCRRTREDRSLQDERFDPPTLSWNFGVSDHSRVINITPERCDAWVSMRPMPAADGQTLIDEAVAEAKRLGLEIELMEGCGPLWSDPDNDHIVQLGELAGTRLQTVAYGTDGGIFDELSRRAVIGPGSIEQAHTVDEWISIAQIERGIDVFEKAIRHWCA
jgi:acetylornithine deacetylase